jgi:hypothetical protein
MWPELYIGEQESSPAQLNAYLGSGTPVRGTVSLTKSLDIFTKWQQCTGNAESELCVCNPEPKVADIRMHAHTYLH